MGKFVTRAEGPGVFINFDDRFFVQNMAPEKAREIAAALNTAAALAEEHRDAQRVIQDQALLIARGLPVGLTNDRHMLHEAHKLAADKVGGIKRQVVFGKPKVTLSRA